MATPGPDQGNSGVLGGPGDDPRPVIPLPRTGPSALAVSLGLGVVAVGLFVFLEGRREQQAPRVTSHPSQEVSVAQEPPPLEIPPPPPPPLPAPPPAPQIQVIERPAPPPPPIIRYIDRPAPPTPQPYVPPQNLNRPNEPPLVVDLGEAAAAASGGEDAAAKATVLRNRAFLVPQGTLIAAVLETPIDSTRPGLVRALTTADTRGFDGTRVLIPRGSRLVGEYHSDIQTGQTRVVVSWNRLVRPDGVAIKLTSPGSDTLGGAGVAGHVDNHIFTRLANAVLQSALTVGVNVASNPGNGSVVVGSPALSIAGSGQTLLPTQDLKPTITVHEGAAITVFTARDLDFAGALPRHE